jgi:FAD binding domain
MARRPPTIFIRRCTLRAARWAGLPATRRLYRDLLTAGDAPPDAPPVGGAAGATRRDATRMPSRPSARAREGPRPEQTSFVGRRRKLAEIDQALGRTRLLTLTGPGGAGKTRLAHEAAARRADAYPDGVHVAELASLSRSELLPQTVAEEGRSLAATVGAAGQVANATHLLGVIALLRGAGEDGETHLSETLGLLDPLPADLPPFFSAVTPGCFWELGRDGQPRLPFTETVLLYRRVGAGQAAAYTLSNLAHAVRLGATRRGRAGCSNRVSAPSTARVTCTARGSGCPTWPTCTAWPASCPRPVSCWTGAWRSGAASVTGVGSASRGSTRPGRRGGGHSVAGFSTCDGGVVIDTSPMQGIRVDPVGRRAVAQPGLTWSSFDHKTQAFGLAVTGGLVSSTGIAGFTLGGGFGSQNIRPSGLR